MQDEFRDIRIAKIFQLIREILFCWFKYHIDEESRDQLEEILNKIQKLKSDAIIQIKGAQYVIIVTLHTEEVKLVIENRVNRTEASDNKLVVFEIAANRAKKRPENGYLSPMTVKLQKNRLIFSISF